METPKIVTRRNRRRRTPGCGWSIAWSIGWIAGLVSMVAIFWFCVPKMMLQRGADGSIQSLHFDWSTTFGKAIWAQMERARKLDE